MATIDRAALADSPIDASFWPAVATAVRAWAEREHVSLRDAVVLVPFAQLIAPARQAFAAQGGWQPRIESTQTLARSIAPPPPTPPGLPCREVAVDRLVGAALLERHGLAAWARRDRMAFEQAVAAMVELAHALGQAAAAMPPSKRLSFWQAARDRLAPVSGPGATERMVSRIALEWAAGVEQAPTDVLFDLVPSAWITVRAGGDDAMAAALMDTAQVPCLVVDCDPDAATPFDDVAGLPPPTMWLCDGDEAEAQATAAQVLLALEAGAQPAALIAHDRVLVRRVRALLEHAGVALHDETGWKLSTTRAAAAVMATLRAAHARAGADARIDWLKAVGNADVAVLEARWRRHGTHDADGLALWERLAAPLSPLTGGRRVLAQWLADLSVALQGARLREILVGDTAGRQVIDTLHLDGGDPAWDAVAAQTPLDLDGFTAWVDTALEQASFVPPDPGGAQVVVTPLARAMLRPFGAVVFPGADEHRLGGPVAPMPLLSESLARELGLPDAAQRRQREALAFAQLLRQPRLVLLRRRSDAGEPLGPSPLIERAALARRRRGLPAMHEGESPVTTQRVDLTPTTRPAPVAASVLPASLSASAVEALRDCPYRFFARVGLGLNEAAELEAALEKRDYGSWLHAALHDFHRHREAPATREAEVAALLAHADRLQQTLGLDAAELLPYRTMLDGLAPMYIDWLHERDVAGWTWADGESSRRDVPPELGGTALHGRLDRIDRHGAVLQLIDYKTGSDAELKKKVKTPLEDTQLAFYAALVRSERAEAVQAMYLALDEREGPIPVEHDNVQASAQALLDGLGADLDAIRRGEGLPALGEGRVCEHCEARGLCRRDDWS